jgi:alpha-1,3-rhamnosyltransferase
MARTPDISVLIPSYNHAPWVVPAARSALSQEGVELEVVVVDDGSTDDSMVRLQEIRDARLQLIVQENRGLSHALNRALGVARGKWAKFLPSDDLLLPGCLPAQLAEVSGCRAVFCRPEVVDGALRQLTDPAPQAWFDLPARQGAALRRELVERNPLSAPCGLFDREAALSVGGFDASLRVAQDYDLWLKLASLGDLRCVPERRVRVRWHGDNQSAATTPASEAERAYALVSALVRDGLEVFAEDGSAAGRLGLLRALARSGMREVQPFMRRLAVEIRAGGGTIPQEPILEDLRGSAPELFRAGPWDDTESSSEQV